MYIEERISVESIVKKMVVSRLRLIKARLRRVDQMKNNPIVRGRGISRKNIGQIMKRDLEVDDLFRPNT